MMGHSTWAQVEGTLLGAHGEVVVVPQPPITGVAVVVDRDRIR